MGDKKLLFQSQELNSPGELAKFLRQLADGLDKQKITLKQGEQEITFDLPNQLKLEVDVDEKKKKGGRKLSLEVELDWLEGQSQGELSIS